MTYKPPAYGLSMADDKYIKEHGLVPNDKGEYPRLDRRNADVPKIQTVDGFISEDAPLEDIRYELDRAQKVWQTLELLFMKRNV